MELVKMILVVAVLLIIGMAGMALTILVKKNGRFPETHIGHNREMRKRNIQCAKSMDRQEQLKYNSGRKSAPESLLSSFQDSDDQVKSTFKGLQLADED
jgi:hypothetical protein